MQPVTLGKDVEYVKSLLLVKNLENAYLGGLDLRGINLRMATLRGANLTNTNLAGAILNYADLQGAKLTGANLTKARFERANLRYADLESAILMQTDLYVAHLENANLAGADMSKALLSAANLMKANLQRTTLHETDLSYAVLNEAMMCEASMKKTILRHASLVNTNLKYLVDFTDVNITYTTGDGTIIRTLRFPDRHVTIAKNYMAIDDEQHSIDDWKNFYYDDDDKVDPLVLDWWIGNKDFVLRFINMTTR